MSDLPVNIDSTYSDDGADASVQLHQAHHDALHALHNAISGATPNPASVGVAPLSQTINNQTGTTYTLVAADAFKVVRCANASPITLTVPPNSSVAFPVGTRVDITQSGAGALTIAQGSGVTINKPATLTLVLTEQWSQVTLVRVATDTWDIAGDLMVAT